MAAGSLGALGSLEDNSTEFLSNTGQAIGTARESSGNLRNVQLDAPEDWAPPTEVPGSTTSTTVDAGTGSSAAPTTATTAGPTSTTVAPTTTTTAPTTTTTQVPVSYQSVPVEVAAGGCIAVNNQGWLSRRPWCDDESNEMTSTHLANGNVVLSTPNGQCFQPWNDDGEVWIDALDCNGDDNQEWWVIPVGDSFMYQNVDSGQCLDLTRGSNGNQWAVQRPCDTGDSGQLLNLE